MKIIKAISLGAIKIGLDDDGLLYEYYTNWDIINQPQDVKIIHIAPELQQYYGCYFIATDSNGEVWRISLSQYNECYPKWKWTKLCEYNCEKHN
jgi:hypothetical protein